MQSKFCNDIVGLYFINLDGKVGRVAGKLCGKDLYVIEILDDTDDLFSADHLELHDLLDFVDDPHYFTNLYAMKKYIKKSLKDKDNE